MGRTGNRPVLMSSPHAGHFEFGAYARNVTSESGEDGILEALLARLPQRDRWCVEFGAWDGLRASNTASLIRSGYSAVLIESDARKYVHLQERYAGTPSVFTLHATVGWDGPTRLDSLLARTPAPGEFDVLSIDIDGNDYHVWAAVKEYRPKLVVIEYNPTIRNGIEFVQPAEATVHQGSSITSLVDLASTKGYELAAATELNAFFVRRELYPVLEITDNSVERIRTDSSWQTEIFFGYDGRAVLRGGKGLYWHGLAVPEQVRMVPRVFVGFPGGFGPIRSRALTMWRGWRYLVRKLRRPRNL